jgi:hypothetical protein
VSSHGRTRRLFNGGSRLAVTTADIIDGRAKPTRPRPARYTRAALALLIAAATVGAYAIGRGTAPTPARAVVAAALPHRYADVDFASLTWTRRPFLVAPLTVRCGMIVYIGTHGEHDAAGQMCRVRIRVTSTVPTFASFDWNWVTLRTDHRAYRPDYQMMVIARQQATPVSIGARDTLDMDVWFDFPRADHPLAVALTGSTPTASLPQAHWPLPPPL